MGSRKQKQERGLEMMKATGGTGVVRAWPGLAWYGMAWHGQGMQWARMEGMGGGTQRASVDGGQ